MCNVTITLAVNAVAAVTRWWYPAFVVLAVPAIRVSGNAFFIMPSYFFLIRSCWFSLYPRFTVYIVIPLHPEGIPTDNAIQEMLHWQKRTMHMMYSRIAHALHIKGIK